MVLLGQTSTLFITLGLILLACINVGAIPVPGVGTSDLTIGDILNLLNLGLVTHINAFITVRFPSCLCIVVSSCLSSLRLIARNIGNESHLVRSVLTVYFAINVQI